MYLAMDDFGEDYAQEIKKLNSEKDKWKRIADIACQYGLKGIQINPSVYKRQMGLSLNRIPNYFEKFRLTYHIGGLFTLESEDDYNNLNNQISEALDISAEHGVEDVSFHPPFIKNENDIIRDTIKGYLNKLIEYWIPRFLDKNITLSLETHVTSKYFVFKGLSDYSKFVSNYRELGVLIDIAHNFYDKYSVDEILDTLKDLKITGLHLSDAISEEEFHKGTHLPIGKGNIDFGKIITQFKDNPNICGALEIKGLSKEISESINILNYFLSNRADH